MRNGFNASVPARKPKTKIGRILTELTSDQPELESAADEEEAPATPGISRSEGSTGEAADEDEVALNALAPAHEAASARARAPGERVESDVASKVTGSVQSRPAGSTSIGNGPTGRDRLASLRDRLSIASRTRTIGAEPKETATAVRELVQDLRARLEAELDERAELTSELEATRLALSRAETELERQRRNWAAVESRAEECSRVADEAVAEAEALAAERDLVLSELSERRHLDDEQAALIAEAEAALERHGEEREAAAREVSELRDLLEVRVTEIVELESRLKAEASSRARVEARCRELEGEVAQLAEASEALRTIEAMVERRR